MAVTAAPPEGAFRVSLDFELLWGVCDHADRDAWGARLAGARATVPRLVEAFVGGGVRATWATVGLLFAGRRDEVEAWAPPEALRPRYGDPRLSAYPLLPSLGPDERRDPAVYGASLVRLLAQAPGQEVGSHTFAHYYCLEPGAAPDSFAADLSAARTAAGGHGLAMRSLVLPRNQCAPWAIEVARAHGLDRYRGPAPGWADRPAARAGQTPLRRAARLLDAHLGRRGPPPPPDAGRAAGDRPASRFLRPADGPLRRLHGLHLAAIRREMAAAARAGRDYHLWWHPHNFGADPEANMAALGAILSTYAALRDAHGWPSRAMGDDP